MKPRILNLKQSGEYNEWLGDDEERVKGIDYVNEDEEIREEEE